MLTNIKSYKVYILYICLFIKINCAKAKLIKHIDKII